MIVATTSNNVLQCLTQMTWKGQQIWVESDTPCPHDGLEVLHHGNGGHFCPTGFLICSQCQGTAIEPEPHECNIWEADA